MSGAPDLYAVLGVAADSPPTAIRAAYLALIRRHHPDRAGSGDGDRAKEINAAFAVLGDPVRRLAYDRSRRAPPSPPPPQAATRPRPTRPRSRLRTARRRLLASAVATAALGVVLLVRAADRPPRMSLANLDRAPPAAAPEAAPRPAPVGVETPDETMVPWPTEGAPRAYAAAGLGLEFAPDPDGGAGALTVRDAAGRTARLVLPAGAAAAAFGVGRLDPASAAPVVLVAFRRAECCFELRALEQLDDGWRVLDLGAWPGAQPAAFPRDLDGDGAPDLTLPDGRFLGAFGPGAVLPSRVLQLRAGALVDVSDSRRFDAHFLQATAATQPLCALGSNTACAAFVADAARAGRLDWAWTIMLAGHDPTVAVPPQCAAPAYDGGCPDGRTKRFGGYPEALAELLRATGHAGQPASPGPV